MTKQTSQTSPQPGTMRGQLIPPGISEREATNPLLSGLHLCSAGVFTAVSHHQVHRPLGDNSMIILACSDGRGSWSCGTSHGELTQGQVLILPAKVGHSYHSDYDEPWTLHWVHLGGRLVPHWQEVLELNPHQTLSQIPERLCADIEKILVCVESDWTTTTLLQASLLAHSIVQSILEQLLDTEVQQQSDPISRSISHMESHIRRPLTVAELADVAGWSTSHYAAQFRSQQGEAPMTFFNRRRIQHACQALDSSSSPISDIALEFGFEDQFYFSRLFKRVTGLSPRAWRQRVKG